MFRYDLSVDRYQPICVQAPYQTTDNVALFSLAN